MPVRKLFWEFPYETQISARVTSVNKDTITLDKTIAFAFSGGQHSDAGTIAGYEIIEAKKEGREIYYTLPADHSLNEGDDVFMKIDWEKRYRMMKLHFAAELVLEIIYQDFNRPEKIGADITAEKARVDFFWEGKISDVFSHLKNKVQYLIDADLEIISGFVDGEKEERYWQIEGFARVQCGGTHLRKTAEIGSITLKRNNIGKGKERIEIYLS